MRPPIKAATRQPKPPEDGAEDDPTCRVGGQSFTAKTKVLLADGKAVPISSLKPGEKVLATNTKTGKNQVETITAAMVHDDHDLYDLKVRADGRTAVIDTTSNHLFWDHYLDKWVGANKISNGEHLKTPDGATVTVVGGTAPKVRDGWMWDLTVPATTITTSTSKPQPRLSLSIIVPRHEKAAGRTTHRRG